MPGKLIALVKTNKISNNSYFWENDCNNVVIYIFERKLDTGLLCNVKLTFSTYHIIFFGSLVDHHVPTLTRYGLMF